MTAPVPLATIADVQTRTEVQLTAEQQARAAVLIGDASAIIRARVPDLPHPPPSTTPGVIATAVLRALASPPDGNKSETTGSHSRVTAHEGGGLYLTEDELDLLRPRRPHRAARSPSAPTERRPPCSFPTASSSSPPPRSPTPTTTPRPTSTTAPTPPAG